MALSFSFSIVAILQQKNTSSNIRNMAIYKNISPSKKLRSSKRLLNFILNKSNKPQVVEPNLEISQQQSISIFPPMPNIDTFEENISPMVKSLKLTNSKVTLTNYPIACKVCNQYQCHFNEEHCFGYIHACLLENSKKLDSCLETPLCGILKFSDILKKPPEK